MTYHVLKRYLTMSNDEVSLGFAASTSGLVDRLGEPVFEEEYAGSKILMLSRLRANEYWIYQGLDGKEPPLDVWRDYYLTSDLLLTDLRHSFSGQFESLKVTIANDDGLKRTSNLLIPSNCVKCFVSTIPISNEMQEQRFEQFGVDFAEDATPLEYVIDDSYCEGLDIFTIANAPTHFTIVSDAFRKVVYRHIPLSGLLEVKEVHCARHGEHPRSDAQYRK